MRPVWASGRCTERGSSDRHECTTSVASERRGREAEVIQVAKMRRRARVVGAEQLVTDQPDVTWVAHRIRRSNRSIASAFKAAYAAEATAGGVWRK